MTPMNVAYGSWLCKNSNVCSTSRKSRSDCASRESNHAAHKRLDTLYENFIFYIFLMYEFSHSLDHYRRFCDVGVMSAFHPLATK